MPQQMSVHQPETLPTQMSQQEFARLARVNQEELFRQYSKSLARSLPIPSTSRQSVVEEPNFSRTMLPGESKFRTSMQIGERPIF